MSNGSYQNCTSDRFSCPWCFFMPLFASSLEWLLSSPWFSLATPGCGLKGIKHCYRKIISSGMVTATPHHHSPSFWLHTPLPTNPQIYFVSCLHIYLILTLLLVFPSCLVHVFSADYLTITCFFTTILPNPSDLPAWICVPSWHMTQGYFKYLIKSLGAYIVIHVC